MTLPKFLIAKYAPDLRRMEPRNFGLIAWSPEAVSARFLGESPDGGIRAPAFVHPDTRHAYKQWVEYWRLMINKKSITTKTGDEAKQSDPRFLDVLRSKVKPQFFLVDAGSLMEAVDPQDFEEMTDELFETLVQDERSSSGQDHSLKLRAATNKVIKRSKVREAGDFQESFPILCPVGTHHKPFTFDYAFGPTESPKAIFHRVLLSQAKSLHSTLFMFEHLKSSNINRLNRITRCAFVYSADIATGDADTANDVDILREYAEVIDVSNEEGAAETVSRLIAV